MYGTRISTVMDTNPNGETCSFGADANVANQDIDIKLIKSHNSGDAMPPVSLLQLPFEEFLDGNDLGSTIAQTYPICTHTRALDRVPPEILGEIFLHILHTPKHGLHAAKASVDSKLAMTNSNSHPTTFNKFSTDNDDHDTPEWYPEPHIPISPMSVPVILSQVCKAWRHAALLTPKLWNRIVLAVPIPVPLSTFDPPERAIHDHRRANEDFDAITVVEQHELEAYHSHVGMKRRIEMMRTWMSLAKAVPVSLVISVRMVRMCWCTCSCERVAWEGREEKQKRLVDEASAPATNLMPSGPRDCSCAWKLDTRGRPRGMPIGELEKKLTPLLDQTLNAIYLAASNLSMSDGRDGDEDSTTHLIGRRYANWRTGLSSLSLQLSGPPIWVKLLTSSARWWLNARSSADISLPLFPNLQRVDIQMGGMQLVLPDSGDVTPSGIEATLPSPIPSPTLAPSSPTFHNLRHLRLIKPLTIAGVFKYLTTFPELRHLAICICPVDIDYVRPMYPRREQQSKGSPGDARTLEVEITTDFLWTMLRLFCFAHERSLSQSPSEDPFAHLRSLKIRLTTTKGMWVFQEHLWASWDAWAASKEQSGMPLEELYVDVDKNAGWNASVGMRDDGSAAGAPVDTWEVGNVLLRLLRPLKGLKTFCVRGGWLSPDTIRAFKLSAAGANLSSNASADMGLCPSLQSLTLLTHYGPRNSDDDAPREYTLQDDGADMAKEDLADMLYSRWEYGREDLVKGSGISVVLDDTFPDVRDDQRLCEIMSSGAKLVYANGHKGRGWAVKGLDADWVAGYVDMMQD